LYGTSTSSSDSDFKVIFLPKIANLLLGKKLQIYKERTDAAGNKVPDGASMPANGIETEYIPLQTFVRDFVRGQTYALEIAHAYLATGEGTDASFRFVQELIEKFSNSDVYSMVGFAKKTTMDYCNRAERLNDAKKVRDALAEFQELPGARLDTQLADGSFALDWIAERTGLKIGTSVNSNKALRTLELNGRSYLQTTTIEHLIKAIEKLIASYGERTNAAAETDVDYKSLGHAIRVYDQAIELLQTGKITFPRPNAEFLLTVKQGKADLEFVKATLRCRDFEVLELLERTTLQKRTPELEAAAEEWLLLNLKDLYNL
jgi:hypothetical protein